MFKKIRQIGRRSYTYRCSLHLKSLRLRLSERDRSENVSISLALRVTRNSSKKAQSSVKEISAAPGTFSVFWEEVLPIKLTLYKVCIIRMSSRGCWSNFTKDNQTQFEEKKYEVSLWQVSDGKFVSELAKGTIDWSLWCDSTAREYQQALGLACERLFSSVHIDIIVSTVPEQPDRRRRARTNALNVI